MFSRFTRRRKVMLKHGESDDRAYFLRDLFTDAFVSPAPTIRTCFPGPGSLSIQHLSAAKFSSGGGALSLPGAGGATQNYARSSGSITRKTGRALVATVRCDSNEAAILAAFATSLTASLEMDPLYTFEGCAHGVFLDVGQFDIITNQKHINSRFRPMTLGVEYKFAIVLQSAGAVYLYRRVSSPADTKWTILNVSRSNNVSTLYPVVAPSGMDGIIKSFEVYDVKGLWSNDNGTAKSATTPGVTISAGYTQQHAADCLLQWSFRQPTTPTTTTSVRVRKVDANNYWRVTHTVTGDLNLDKVVASVPVNVINAPLVLAATTRNIVTLRMEGNNYALHIDNIAPDGYMFTTANHTATDSHAISATTLEVSAAQGTALRDLVEWPIQYNLWDE